MNVVILLVFFGVFLLNENVQTHPFPFLFFCLCIKYSNCILLVCVHYQLGFSMCI